MSARTTTVKPSLTVVDGKTAPLSEILAILDRDGGVIVHNMLTPEVVTRMLEMVGQLCKVCQPALELPLLILDVGDQYLS